MNITDESTVGTDYEKLNFFETWLGVQYVAREWTYTNGTAIQYSKWRAGEPNNFKNLTEGCAIFFDVWNDLNCDTKIKYLCGLPKGK